MPPLAPPVWAVEPADYAAIAKIVEATFEQPDEARLVERLRADGVVIGEWIATVDQKPVGHIMFSRGALAGDPDINVACLAPLAVLPAQQKTGVGAALIRYALSELAVEGIDLIYVLGDPAYYRQFGFDSEFGHAFDTPWRDAGEANMVMALSQTGAKIGGGALEFAAAMTAMGH